MRAFTVEEEQFIKENNQCMSQRAIARELGRDPDTVHRKMKAMKLTKPSTIVPYTDHEKAIITKYFPTYGVKKCLSFLPNRSYHAVAKQAQKLGLKLNITESRRNNGVKAHDLPKYVTRANTGYLTCTKTKRLIHRIKMEEHLGRPLDSSEIVHHINGDKEDNRVKNLVIVSRAEHINIHRKAINNSKR